MRSALETRSDSSTSGLNSKRWQWLSVNIVYTQFYVVKKKSLKLLDYTSKLNDPSFNL